MRGRVDLIINGSFWLGAAARRRCCRWSLLDTAIFAADVGWRLAFGLGAVLGLGILFVRRHVPESPRWLFIHGREEEAERIVADIEREVDEETGEQLAEPEGDAIKVAPAQERSVPRDRRRSPSRDYPQRTVLGLGAVRRPGVPLQRRHLHLGTVLTTFYGVDSGTVPVYIVAVRGRQLPRAAAARAGCSTPSAASR